jgi:hypothetical protein
MRTDRQLDDAISRWLEAEAPRGLSDRVLRATFERTRKTRQQGGWQALLRRLQVNRMLAVLAGVAAVAVVAVVAVGLYVNQPGGIGGVPPTPTQAPTPTTAPSPTAVPTATPVPSAAATPEPTAPEPTYGPLAEGPYVLVHEQLLDVRMTVTIPAPDWHGLPTFTFLEKHGMAGPPRGAGLTVWGGNAFVYGDPCAWESTRPDDPVASLDELVAALSAQASRDATAPVDVTVGGYPGKMLTLRVPDDADFTDCDRGEFRTLIEVETGDARIHQGPGQIDEVWIVDVDGTLIYIDAGYFADTPAEDVEEMRAMVESATFQTP